MQNTYESDLSESAWQPSLKVTILNFEKGKKSQIRDNALVLFPRFRLFLGRVLGSYLSKRHDVTMTWPFEKIFHRTNTVMNKDNGMLWSCMCSLIEILWVLEEKISLNCWQVQHDVAVTEIFEFNLHVNFLYFLWNWVNLLGIFTTCDKLRAFERNQNLENSCLMSWRPIV